MNVVKLSVLWLRLTDMTHVRFSTLTHTHIQEQYTRLKSYSFMPNDDDYPQTLVTLFFPNEFRKLKLLRFWTPQRGRTNERLDKGKEAVVMYGRGWGRGDVNVRPFAYIHMYVGLPYITGTRVSNVSHFGKNISVLARFMDQGKFLCILSHPPPPTTTTPTSCKIRTA